MSEHQDPQKQDENLQSEEQDTQANRPNWVNSGLERANIGNLAPEAKGSNLFSASTIKDNVISVYNYYYRDDVRVTPIQTDKAIAQEKLPCPYRGLFHFSPQDAEFFFGRDIFVRKLVQATQSHNFIAVLGASGSGKSSVVLAGLVPELQQAGYWQFTHFRPGSDPFHAIALALVPLYTPNLDETDQIAQARKLVNYLQEGSVPLTDVFAQIQQHYSPNRVLLIADQFEELYTLCRDESLRRRFLDCLLASLPAFASQSSSSLVMVLTMRADFLGNALSYRPFADRLQNADIKLGVMNRSELSQVIEKPAERLGITFEAGLVERILDDVENEPGHLPLLEFALTELWEKRIGKQLSHGAYEAIGQVKGALADYADEKYNKLTPIEQEQTRRIFIQLVRPGEGTQDTRRRANRAELKEENWNLITRKNGLADSRLVVTNRNDTEPETVEVVHEALIKNWGQLRQWMETDRRFRTWQEWLRTAMRQWQNNKQDEGALLRGLSLAQAEDWLQKRQKDLSQTEQAYIEASLARHRQEQDERKKEQNRRNRNKIMISIISFSIPLIFGLVVIALVLKQVADSLNFTAQAISQMRTDPEESLRLAIKAMDTYPTTLAEDALRKSLLASRIRAKIQIPEHRHDNTIWTVAFSSDSQYVVATNSKSGEVKVLNINTDKPDTRISSVKGQAFTNGNFVLTVSDNGVATRWDVITGKVKVLSNNLKGVTSAAFSSDGQLVFTSDNEKPGQIWNTTTGEVKDLSGSLIGDVVSAAFSSDKQFLATVSFNGDRSRKAKLWNVNTGSFIQDLPGHIPDVTHVRFSRDSNYIATACGFDDRGDNAGCYRQLPSGEYEKCGKITCQFDGTVRIWKKEDNQFKSFHDLPVDDKVYGLAFDHKSQLLATASGDKVARVWDISTGKQVSVFIGHTNWVWSAAFSPDSNLVVTAGSKGRVARVWQTQTGLELLVLLGHQGFVSRADFSPDGKFILTIGDDGTARIWDVNTRRLATQSDLTVLKGIPEPEPSVIERIEQHSTNWNRIVSSSDRKLMVTFNDQELTYTKAIVWQADTAKVIRELGESKDGFIDAAFSLDNKFVVLVDQFGNTARIWEISTGREVELIGHSSFVKSAAFSPNNACVVTASEDETIRVWQPNTGDIMAMLQAPSHEIVRVAFDPSGKSILALDENNKAWMYSSEGCASIQEIRTVARSSIEKNARKY